MICRECGNIMYIDDIDFINNSIKDIYYNCIEEIRHRTSVNRDGTAKIIMK